MNFFSNSCGMSNAFRACVESWTSLDGWWRMCELITNFANCWSCIGSYSSLTTHRMSKRDKIGSDRFTFSENVMLGSYRPPIGLEAAMTAQRACSDVTRPAFEIEIDCCSMASWILVRSWSFILSNSSIKQTPWSASTKAPASSVHSLDTGFLRT